MMTNKIIGSKTYFDIKKFTIKKITNASDLVKLNCIVTIINFTVVSIGALELGALQFVAINV